MKEKIQRAGQMDTETTEGLEVPARVVPVPDTVSPEMQAIIARPHDPAFNDVPTTAAGWKAKVAAAANKVEAALPAIRQALGVAVAPTVIAGVKAFVVTPTSIPEKYRDRLLIHLHGGVRV